MLSSGVCCACKVLLICALGVLSQAQVQTGSSGPKPTQQPAAQRRIVQTRKVPGARAATAALLGRVQTSDDTPIPGTKIGLFREHARPITALADSDGIFRIGAIPPGNYDIRAEARGFLPMVQPSVALNQNEVLTIELRLTAIATGNAAATSPAATPATTAMATEAPTPPVYKELSRRLNSPPAAAPNHPEVPRDNQIMVPEPDRWDLDMPSWQRFGQRSGDFPYASSHWWDPFNRNILKGDKPVIGQDIFFNFTGTSTTALDVRRLYVPSGVSAQNPGSFQFFGKGGQAFVQETVRMSFDLFKGDTSFKPVDWRIRFTPAFNVNQLWAREKGIVNIDVREGTSRTDGHVGIQEAFVEKKLADLGPNYDFISIRAGVQQFTSDFRGFLFTQEQPGVRLFGNLKSNRLQYNAAYFFFLEKDTNSGLNRFRSRHQQVALANFYIQDFLTKGYTTQFSYHYNKDDASVHYDENGFLVRPAPIGAVKPHEIRAHYIGWTGNGHIGRINVSNAFYQALGYDSLNPIAGRHTDIDAQMGALELSIDKDWVRLRASGFFASGDSNPRDGTARGFDAISEGQEFAGGIFSFFNREGIRLTGTGVALTSPDSFLPDLRSSKEEGQANFVNPGIFLVNAGADFDLTPQIKLITNVNYMRFHHTAPLDLLLFQSNIKPGIGTDYSVGINYRPPLSENMVVTGGVAALTPGTGLKQIYTGRTLMSAFTAVRFQF